MKNIAIFASGNGSNAENIVRTFAAGNRVRVAVVLTNKENAGVIARMENLGIPVLYFPNEVWDTQPVRILEAMAPYGVDLVVLAGFMRKVQDPIVEAFEGRMLNIHPSLIPAYCGKGMYGHKVHEAVVAAGEKQSGVTVHMVTSDIDSGEIVMQGIVELPPDETPASLEEKIHEIEYEIYPRAIVKVLRGNDTTAGNAPAAVPPPLPRMATPDEQWAQALNIPYDPPRTEKQEAATPPVIPASTATVPPPMPTAAPLPAAAPCCAPAAAAVPLHAEETDKPASPFLAWSIVFLILFGPIPAVVALIYSIRTRRLNGIGDYAGARHASSVCQGWLIASFCIGVLMATLYLPVMIAASIL